MLHLAGIEVNLVFGLVCTLRPNPCWGTVVRDRDSRRGSRGGLRSAVPSRVARIPGLFEEQVRPQGSRASAPRRSGRRQSTSPFSSPGDELAEPQLQRLLSGTSAAALRPCPDLAEANLVRRSRCSHREGKQGCRLWRIEIALPRSEPGLPAIIGLREAFDAIRARNALSASNTVWSFSPRRFATFPDHG